MELKHAVAHIKKWRDDQNLDALSPSEERIAASKFISQKGWNLPTSLPSFEGNLQFIEGVYTKAMEVVKVSEIFSWNPLDKRELWCQKLGFFVRLTGDLDTNGTYYVTKLGEGNFRRYPVRAYDLVLKEEAPQDAPSTDLLLVNQASWGDIKNYLVDKFIPSFPWSRKGDKTPADIRGDMESLAKSRHKGLAKLIEEERQSSRGAFEDQANFTIRLTTLHESFPWAEFAQMLDFAQ